MGVKRTDFLIAERLGDSKKFQASQLMDEPNELYNSVSGNIVLNSSFPTQIIKMSGNVNVTGVGLPSVNYSVRMFIYIDSTTSDDFTLPTAWKVVGEYNKNTNINVLILDLGNYPEGVEVVGYWINDKNLGSTINNLTNTSTTNPLSANQGRILNNRLTTAEDTLSDMSLLHRYKVYDFDTLPTSPSTGEIAVINDAKGISYRGIASGRGSDIALVLYDGSDWIYH